MEPLTSPATKLSSFWELRSGDFVATEGVPITDRGFRYGLHSFETLRVKNGRAEFAGEHVALLQQSPWAAGFAEWQTVREWIGQSFPTDGMLRLFLTAGEGPLTAAATVSRFYAWFEPRDFSALPESVAVALSPEPIWPQPGSGKTGNYYQNLAALDAAKARGFDEAWRFDRHDQLVGACLANVFYRRSGQWFTPPGFRAGVMRGLVMRQLPVEIRPLKRSDVAEVESAFLTSSGIGVLPVRCIGDRILKEDFSVMQLRTAERGRGPFSPPRAVPTQ